ncbi:AAA family ATPase [Streptomyces sp. NPDC050658]|uniref:AAA family ATPase n=1 Tax=unclassified Streptomyces TaxID=2593676 RepID=UPI0034165441
MTSDQRAAAAQILAANGITGEEAAQQPERRLRITPLSKIRLRGTYWLWDNRIPIGGLTLWAGREGIGKSTSAAWLAARVTRGELPGVHLGNPRSVFYAASEDSWERTVAPRLVAAGADLERTFRIDVVEEERPGVAAPLTLPADTSTLGKEMLAHDVGLLVVDPLVSALNGAIDTHRDREVRSALEPLGQIADQAGAAVLGLVHFGKGSSTDPLSLILGSRAFAATARAVIAMARDPQAEDGAVILSQEKNNLGRLDLPSLTYVVQDTPVETEDGRISVGRVEFTGESSQSVGDVLADSGTAPEERSERAEAVAWLRDFLTRSGGEASAEDVFKAGAQAGFEKHTLRRCKPKAQVKSEKAGFDGGWVWRMDP